MSKQKFVFQWHITHKCNLRCKHCYQEDYSKELSILNLTNIYNQVRDWLIDNNYIGHINFTGGEPLASEHFWKLISMCEMDNISFGILTNGTLLNEENVERLSHFRKLSFIQISLDGLQNTHDTIRGKGNFDKAVSSLKLLKKHNIQSMVSFTLTKSNYTDLKKIIRFCEKIKVDRFWTDRLVPIGSNTEQCLTTEEYKEILNLLGRESRRAEKLPWVKTKVHTNRALQFMCLGSDKAIYECSAGKHLLAVLADGTLLPCRRLPLEIGNLTQASLKELVDNSDLLNKLRNSSIPEDCKACMHSRECHGGAKCITYAVTGKLNGKDINCIR